MQILFSDEKAYPFESVVDELRDYWKVDITNTSITQKGKAVSFYVGQSGKIDIAFEPNLIKKIDFTGMANGSYFWQKAIDDIPKTKTIASLSMSHADPADLTQHMVLTIATAAALNVFDEAMGVCYEPAGMLISKNNFIDYADELIWVEPELPTPLWVYVGLVKNEKNNGFTRGLSVFGKPELEIVGSDAELHYINTFLNEVAGYILRSGKDLHPGETVGLTAEEKIPISISKGVFIDGETLKLHL